MKTAIDGAGRLVIPKTIRDKAGFKPGMALEVVYRDGRVEIEAVKRRMKKVRKGFFWVLESPGMPTLTQEQVNATIESLREERMEELMKMR